jgi:hypothetical protein
VFATFMHKILQQGNGTRQALANVLEAAIR